MRLGILADVHANLHALRAVLALLASERVDAYLCAGDLVGYGAQPNECVARVGALAGRCVAGNHDLIALGVLSEDGCSRLATESLRWTAGQLTSTTREVLTTLPRVTALGQITMAHGALEDPQRYIRTSAEALAELAALERTHPESDLLVLGHTHLPLVVGERRGELLRGGTGTVQLERGERYLLNPGSVGQSRERLPHARALVLDLERRSATFHALAFDISGCRAELRRVGQPTWSCHLSPTRSGRVRRKAASAVRRWRGLGSPSTRL